MPAPPNTVASRLSPASFRSTPDTPNSLPDSNICDTSRYQNHRPAESPPKEAKHKIRNGPEVKITRTLKINSHPTGETCRQSKHRTRIVAVSSSAA
jgi:hypothetical protein